MTYTIEQKNNAINAYMGGANYVIEKHYPSKKVKELELNDLLYDKSWDWIIPVWKKVRFDMSPMMVIHAITCIDDDVILELHQIISQVCIDWCKNNNIKL